MRNCWTCRHNLWQSNGLIACYALFPAANEWLEVIEDLSDNEMPLLQTPDCPGWQKKKEIDSA